MVATTCACCLYPLRVVSGAGAQGNLFQNDTRDYQEAPLFLAWPLLLLQVGSPPKIDVSPQWDPVSRKTTIPVTTPRGRQAIGPLSDLWLINDRVDAVLVLGSCLKGRVWRP